MKRMCFGNKSGKKSEKWNGKPRLECVNGQRPSLKTPVGVPPGHGVKGNDLADRLAGQATLTSGLLLGRPEALRSLRHYLWVQSRRHHANDRLEERVVKEEALDDLS